VWVLTGETSDTDVHPKEGGTTRGSLHCHVERLTKAQQG
jgi:hypothetical protein